MASSKQQRIVDARKLYIRMFGYAEIARIFECTERTVQAYRKEDEHAGEKSWDTLRAEFMAHGTEKPDGALYTNFLTLMHQALEEITGSDLTALEKSDAIKGLGDSFLKMQKVAMTQDPETFKYGIAKQVVLSIAKALNGKLCKECMPLAIDAMSDKAIASTLDTIRVPQ